MKVNGSKIFNSRKFVVFTSYQARPNDFQESQNLNISSPARHGSCYLARYKGGCRWRSQKHEYCDITSLLPRRPTITFKYCSCYKKNKNFRLILRGKADNRPIGSYPACSCKTLSILSKVVRSISSQYSRQGY